VPRRWRDRLQGLTARPSRRVLAVGAGLGLLFGPGLVQLGLMAMKERALDRRLADLAARKEALTRERDRLEHDPGYVEGLIRSTFKVAKENELVVPLDDDPSAGPLRELTPRR